MLSSLDQQALLLNVFKNGKQITYRKGEYIIRPGDIPPGVFYIENGLVKCYDITKYGEENLLMIRKEDELLGLTWTITHEKRDIIYSAMTETTVRLVPHDTFRTFLRENPTAGLPVVELVTEMYRWHSEHIISLEYRSVRERLMAFLLMLADRFGQETAEGTLINVPIRHQDIASSINSSRETTSRELATLQRKGLIKSEQAGITLLDIPAMEKQL